MRHAEASATVARPNPSRSRNSDVLSYPLISAKSDACRRREAIAGSRRWPWRGRSGGSLLGRLRPGDLASPRPPPGPDRRRRRRARADRCFALRRHRL